MIDHGKTLSIRFKGFDEWHDLSPLLLNPTPYPYLAIDEQEYLLVMFVAPERCVVLCSTKAAAGAPGDVIDDAFEEHFFAIETTCIFEQTDS